MQSYFDLYIFLQHSSYSLYTHKVLIGQGSLLAVCIRGEMGQSWTTAANWHYVTRRAMK
jgi:hypothetical protein